MQIAGAYGGKAKPRTKKVWVNTTTKKKTNKTSDNVLVSESNGQSQSNMRGSSATFQSLENNRYGRNKDHPPRTNTSQNRT